MTDLTPGTWTLDAAHTSVAFTVRHAGISKARGQFPDAEGTLTVGEGGKDLAFSVSLKTATINTSNEDRDNHLRSADFFDVENFPEITFVSTKVEGDTLVGDLTIRDVTKPVTLDVEIFGQEEDPFGNTRVGFEAATKINRKDFGVDFQAPLNSGGVLVSETIAIEVEGSAIKS